MKISAIRFMNNNHVQIEWKTLILFYFFTQELTRKLIRLGGKICRFIRMKSI